MGWWGGEVVIHKILETAQTPDLGLRTWTWACQPGIWNLVYGLWTEDDSGLRTGPLTFSRTLLKHFFDSLDSRTHSCPLPCYSDSYHGPCSHTQTLQKFQEWKKREMAMTTSPVSSFLPASSPSHFRKISESRHRQKR